MRRECKQGKEIVAVEEGGGGIQDEGSLNVLIHRNTASNQCTALRLAEQLRGVRQQYIHVSTEGQREGDRGNVLAACDTIQRIKKRHRLENEQDWSGIRCFSRCSGDGGLPV